MGNSIYDELGYGRSVVHPHVHGELERGALTNAARSGSSPRAWGTHRQSGPSLRTRRFIPTCMGNSWGVGRGGVQLPVHPHVHGELVLQSMIGCRNHGSSPRAWGTHGRSVEKARIPRFIPTCMGNSDGGGGRCCDVAVHPHVHGELDREPDRAGVLIGSSPRAWGTLNTSTTTEISFRFIPTCMGNSSTVLTRQRFATVHPHVHGELYGEELAYTTPDGSSPRAWGTRWREPVVQTTKRFIPTCMGNSASGALPIGLLWVHPHVHGELFGNKRMSEQKNGSSPRAWGTHKPGFVCSMNIRFIPTCMGNSKWTYILFGALSVHPHVHGELLTGKEYMLLRIGSSPRAWGTLRTTIPVNIYYRFIPTCMGNSPAEVSSIFNLAVHPHVHGELTNFKIIIY